MTSNSPAEGFKKYQDFVNDYSKPFLERIFEENRDELTDIYKNILYDLNGPRYINRKQTKEDHLFSKIFFGFIEIRESYEALLDFEVYFARYPYRNTRISLVRHIRFCVESYLNEIYILKERMVSYLNIIQK
ncbi:hypothetical protein ACFLT7_04310, partial [candidate division KSB1 bacterium]